MYTTYPLGKSVSAIALGRKSRLYRRFFHFVMGGNWILNLQTIVYIDGYNLYYSALKNSPYKWLDLYELFANKVIRSIEPMSEVISVKYFTAPALARYTKDVDAPNRQVKYHNALKVKLGECLEIIEGYHSQKETTAYPVDTNFEAAPIKVNIVEEKQTDVNLGLHMYRDAVRRSASQLVLVSNDSDLAPALEMIKRDYPEIKIGVVLPVLSPKKGVRKSGQLQKSADWTRQYLRADELVQSQLPETLQNRKNKTIRKPECWQ